MTKSRAASTQVGLIVLLVAAVATFVVTYLQLDPRRLLPKISITSLKSSITPTPPPTTSTTTSSKTTLTKSNGSDVTVVDINSHSVNDSKLAADSTKNINNSAINNVSNTTSVLTDENSDILSLSNGTTQDNVIEEVLCEEITSACDYSLSNQSIPGDASIPLSSVSGDTPPVLLDYISWHKRERECFLKSGTTCDGKTPRIMVWRCFTVVCGGLGDRMRGIRFLLMLSIATRRLFFLDWPQRVASPYPLTLALKPASIDWRVPIKTLNGFMKQPNIRYVNAVPYNEKRRRLIGTKRVHVHPNKTDFQSLWSDTHVVFFTNRMARSSIHLLSDNPSTTKQLAYLDRRHMPLAKLERTLMHILFSPTDIVKRLADTRAAFTKPYVAAHARTGADVGEGRGPRLGYISSHLREAAMRLFECTRDVVKPMLCDANITTTDDEQCGKIAIDETSSQRIFLASDSYKLKEEFIKIANESGVSVKTEDRIPLHIDRKGSARSVRKDDEVDMCHAFLDVFADVYALAGQRAHAFVYFHSGFAATAESVGEHAVTQELLGNGAGTIGECIPRQKRKGKKIPTYEEEEEVDDDDNVDGDEVDSDNDDEDEDRDEDVDDSDKDENDSVHDTTRI